MKQKYITLQLRLACLSHPVIKKKTIHAELEDTIAERKKIMEQLRRLYEQRKRPVMMRTGREAA